MQGALDTRRLGCLRIVRALAKRTVLSRVAKKHVSEGNSQKFWLPRGSRKQRHFDRFQYQLRQGIASCSLDH